MHGGKPCPKNMKIEISAIPPPLKWILAGGPESLGNGLDLLNVLVEKDLIKYCLSSGMFASIGSYGIDFGFGGGGSRVMVLPSGAEELRQDFAGAGGGKGKVDGIMPSSLQTCRPRKNLSALSQK